LRNLDLLYLLVITAIYLHNYVLIYKTTGLLVLVEDEEKESLFSQHFELAYEFETGKYHIGPITEIGFEKHSVHAFGGLQFGMHF